MRFENPCKQDCPKRTGDCHAACPHYALWKLVDELARKADSQRRLADVVLSEHSKDRSTRWLRKKNVKH